MIGASLLARVALVVPALAAVALTPARSPAQERIERGLAASADATIRVYTLSGSTVISGWKRDSVAIVAEHRPQPPSNRTACVRRPSSQRANTLPTRSHGTQNA